MMNKKKPAKKAGHERSAGSTGGLEGSTTLIAQNTCLTGDVRFEDRIYVNGVIEGDVSAEDNADATLVICEGGRVSGEIRVPNVVIDGTVEGDVYASGKLELAAKAKVAGNVHYNLVEMQLGSVVNGQMVSLADTVSEMRVVSDDGGKTLGNTATKQV